MTARYSPAAVRKAPLLVLLLLQALCTASCSSGAETVPVHFRKGGGGVTPTIAAEIADSAGEIRLGLMYRKKLADDAGMLFVFSNEKPRSFWMKNTYVELDMIFADAQGEVVKIIRRAVPLSTIGRKSGKPAKYVLEVVGGSADAWGLQAGDTLVLPEHLM